MFFSRPGGKGAVPLAADRKHTPNLAMMDWPTSPISWPRELNSPLHKAPSGAKEKQGMAEDVSSMVSLPPFPYFLLDPPIAAWHHITTDQWIVEKVQGFLLEFSSPCKDSALSPPPSPPANCKPLSMQNSGNSSARVRSNWLGVPLFY